MNQVLVYAEFAPILLVGFLGGFISYFRESEDRPFHLRKAIGHILTAMFTTAIAYALMDLTEWTYLAKMGIAAAVGFMGWDKAYSIIDRIINKKV